MKCLDKLPSSLANLKKPPKKLYYIGDISLLDKPIVAIVGSRRPNAYTKRLVTNLSSSLAKRGVHVISGAAMGVDAVAHLGSYPKTIGVMGNSLDIIYPKINQELILNMQKNSLIISEYEPNTKATKWSFIDRNRLVVALSQAVVIAQADEKSGSMHSAKIALKQGKPLFVLPQRLEDSKGTNALLAKNEAKIINDIDEFCNNFKNLDEVEDEIIQFCKNKPSLQTCLEKFGDKIYEYELDGKISINGLHVRIL